MQFVSLCKVCWFLCAETKKNILSPVQTKGSWDETRPDETSSNSAAFAATRSHHCTLTLRCSATVSCRRESLVWIGLNTTQILMILSLPCPLHLAFPLYFPLSLSSLSLTRLTLSHHFSHPTLSLLPAFSISFCLSPMSFLLPHTLSLDSFPLPHLSF